ncbi:MAG: RNA polymerase sigma factor RpoD/SigA [Oscillospiraceae bacterium]|nr:RNA polymerase sigma factor RpoD/SigA [Oscillospiraceae bacterium]
MSLTLQDIAEIAVSHGEDEAQQYLQQIRAIPRLTYEQERALAKRCAAGDEEAIRMMVSANLRLVVSVAREYAGRGVPLMDLIQEGSIGLLTAARKFDYTLDYRFSTYATKWIRQGVTRSILNHTGLIRVPVHTAERIRKVLSVKAALQQELEREPTIPELAEKTGFSEKKVLEYLSVNPEVCSLDTATGEDEDGALRLLLEDLQAPQPQEALVRRELEHTMDALLGQLTERQRQVLRLRFGMEDGTCWRLEAIGEKLGVSKERARQLERQAMDKLQQLGTGLGLEDFLE